MTRDAFIDRVRTAAAAGRAYCVAPRGEVTDRTGYVGVTGDLVQRFASEVNTVGGHAHVVHDTGGVRRTVLPLLQQYGAHSALCWQHPVLDRIGLNAILAEAHVTAIRHDDLAARSPQERQRTILAADVGITSADFAIAETGTLVLCSKPGQERLTSLAPPVHIAIVERSQIVPDLLDLFDRLATAGNPTLPSNLVLITGPSKTGDIELQLTTGVHGPGHWHVVILNP